MAALPHSQYTPFQRFTGCLNNVKRYGPHRATAHCPAHDDRHNSLSIDEGDDGRVLIYDHAGCEPEAIVAAVGLTMPDLFPPKAPTIRQNGHGRRIVTTYDYRDESGTLLYQSVRYDPKDFRQRRPDGKGGWIWNLDGTKRVLCGLPELLAADPDEPVLNVEGEKDFERLRALGVIATCNVGGAGKWRPEYSESLRDRHVVILPDNDDAGRKHAETVAQALNGIAASVRVVMLPDLPPKGDVSDWLDAGGDKAQLKALIDATPPWSDRDPTPPVSNLVGGPRLIVTSLDKVQPKAVKWIWPRWLARGKLHILGGHPGDGKSTLLAALAAVGSARGLLPDDTPAPLTRWLFLLAEDALDDTFRPRLDVHGADPSQIFAIEAVKEADGQDRLFNLGVHLSLLEDAIREHQIDVVVIDPLTSFMARSDRNAEGDVRDALTPAGKLAERTGVAVIGIMHVGKPNGSGRRPLQQLLGATAFGAIARIVWMVAPCPDDAPGTRRLLGMVKSNLSIKPAPLEWSRTEDGPIVWHGVSSHALDDVLSGTQPTPRADAEGFLRETLDGGSVPAVDVIARAAKAGISERTLRRAAEGIPIDKYKQPGITNGQWLWKLPNGKMATPQDGQVAAFDSSHESEKMSTLSTSGHLPDDGQDGQDGQDGHVAPVRGGHLRFGDEPARTFPPSDCLAPTACDRLGPCDRHAAGQPCQRTTGETP